MANPLMTEARPRAHSQPGSSASKGSDRDRLELILDAGRILDDAPDLAASWRALARLLAGRLGDACVIDVLTGGAPAPLAVVHADPDLAAEAQELRRRFPPLPEDRAGVSEVLRSGRPELYAELGRGGREPDHLRAFREMGMSSAMIAVIRTRRRTVGSITVFAGAERRFEQGDLRILEEIAARAALAAAAQSTRDGRPVRSENERERLLVLEKAARAAAEVAVHRISTLQAVTASLSEAVTLAQVADIIVGEGVGSLGASIGTLHLIDAERETLELVAYRGVPADNAELLAAVPLTDDCALVRAALAGEAEWVVGSNETSEACPSAVRSLTREGGLVSLAAIPLSVGGGVAGVLSLAFDEAQVFPEEDRVFALALVRHCAQAIDRARLFEAERRSNRRHLLLAKAGELLSSSIDYETTIENVARFALPALGDYAFFDVRGEGGASRRIARTSAWPETEAELGSLVAAPPGPVSARIQSIVDEHALGAIAGRVEDLPLLRSLGLRSLLSVPLAARGEVLGALTLAFGPSGRRHTSADLEIAKELAHRAAIAVENAALHRASREATQRAQEANRRSELANRAKDEFLGVVSHELRTPLNAVLGWAQLLRGPCASDPAVLAKGLKVIDRNARAQAKLIEDLLDVSRIITGKLRLELRPMELEGVIRAAIEVIRPAADAKGIELRWTIESGTTVMGDPDRLQQVVWNLVSNAVKFTPEGGRVDVVLARMKGGVAIVVRDSGRGIEPDVLPHVFERFWQADSSPTRRHGGLGLGLAIVRHLVELHGGNVRADSAGPGRGATFTVELPAREESTGDTMPGTRGSGDTDPGRTPTRLDGLTVLLVDDEPDARELVSTLLSTAGAAVRTAGSAVEAIAALEEAIPHVLVSDVAMPGEDGYALIRRVRANERWCRLPALALTAYAGPEDARRAVLAGFHTHLPKPAEPAMLTAVVASLGGRVAAE